MAMRAAVAAVVLMACAAPRAETLEKPVRRPKPVEPDVGFFVPTHKLDRTLSAVRPEIDAVHFLPDPHEEIRWPLSLSTHPVLEPSYPIADAMAEPGVGWIDLCVLGAQNRHASAGGQDLLRYLRGWCRVADHDADRAIAELSPLLDSVTVNLAAAVRHDIANILADYGHADDAEKLLARHRVTDVPVLDLLAATYVEVGSTDGALEINDLALRTDRGGDASLCQRLTRKILLLDASSAMSVLEQLHAAAARLNQRCVELDRQVTCSLLPTRKNCAPFLTGTQFDKRTLQVLDLYFEWPTAPTTAHDWWLLTYQAINLLPARGADALALTALETALRATPCDPANAVFTAKTYAGEIQQMKTHDASLDPRLDALIQHGADQCVKP